MRLVLPSRAPLAPPQPCCVSDTLFSRSHDELAQTPFIKLRGYDRTCLKDLGASSSTLAL